MKLAVELDSVDDQGKERRAQRAEAALELSRCQNETKARMRQNSANGIYADQKKMRSMFRHFANIRDRQMQVQRQKALFRSLLLHQTLPTPQRAD